MGKRRNFQINIRNRSRTITSIRDRILAELPLILAQNTSNSAFYDWAKESVITDSGTPIHFSGHKALEPIYKDPHPDQVWIKGAQIGGTYLAIGKALYIPDALGKDCIYYLPDQNFASIFVKTRVKQILQKSRVLRSKLKIIDVSAGIVQAVSGASAYFRGLHSITGAISIPSHANIYDEVDMIPADNLEWSEDRLSAAEHPIRIFLCVPMYPGSGIDQRFQMSDRHRWVVTCPRCKHESILEEEFPKNIQESSDGAVDVVCVKCGKILDRQKGNWVAENPGADIRGYKISQLCIGQIQLKNIWKKYKTANQSPSKLAKFNCSVLAKADAGNMQPITDETLRLCRMDNWIMVDQAAWSYCGIDVGDICHIVIMDILESGRERILWLESCPSEKLIERMKYLFKAYGIFYCVGDAMPYKSELKKLAAAFPDSVSIRYYGKDADIEQDVEQKSTDDLSDVRTVSMGRNESIDDAVDMFKNQSVIVPVKRYGDVALNEFDFHVKQWIKEKRIDAKGNTIYSYKKNVPNHYGMAYVNARIAVFVKRISVNTTGSMPVFEDILEE